MSSSKFSDDSARRVARPVSASNAMLMASLQYKRAALSQGVAGSIAGKSPAKKSGNKHKYGAGKKKSKLVASDEEEDDFIDDEEASEEEDFELSDDEPRKRKKPVKKATPPAKNPVLKISFGKSKESRLSESSEDEKEEEKKKVSPLARVSGGGEWQSKPRLQKMNSDSVDASDVVARPMQTQKKTRRIVLSSDSEEEEKKEESPKDNKPVTPVSLKAVAKAAAKEKKKEKRGGGADSDDEDGLGSDDDEMVNGGEETPSDDSDDDRRTEKQRRADSINEQATCEFFNTAERQALLDAPRMNEKMADHVLATRPFGSFSALRESISSIPRGTAAIDAYMEYVENRGVLEKILDDCKQHAKEIAECFDEATRDNQQPKLLSDGCRLHEYQQMGLNWLVMMHRKGFNCILGDEMGLGKTIQVISFIAWMKEHGVRGPHLVVVPSSTVENWMKEIAKWCPTVRLLTYYGTMDERKHIRAMAKKQKDTTDVVLTTYNMVGSKSDDKKFFKHFRMNYVIYDEGHMLKNCGTERYRSLMKIKGDRKILLTGTPLQNNLIELISLMYFVMTDVFTRYCEDITQLLGHFKQQGPSLEGGENARALYQRDRIEQAKAILQPYILRRLKANVLSNLPPKTDEVVMIEMDERQARIYEQVVEALRGDGEDDNNAYGNLIRLRQAANHPLLVRTQFDLQKLQLVARTLVSKENQYSKKKVADVAEDFEFLSDLQLHQLCEKYTSTSKFLLDESLALESGKCKYLDKKLPEIKDKGDKVLIFSQFTSVLDILEVYLRQRGHDFVRLDGSTPVMERQEMIDAFNSSPTQFVFLLSTRAGGLGINLTSANHIIIHDIDFNPYNDKQAEDRCHRMGQKKPVHVIRLIAEGTVETGIYKLARKKLQLEKDVTDGSRGQDSNGEKDEKLDKRTLNKLMKEALSPRKHKSPQKSPRK